jgi:hypothetical protein
MLPREQQVVGCDGACNAAPVAGLLYGATSLGVSFFPAFGALFG